MRNPTTKYITAPTAHLRIRHRQEYYCPCYSRSGSGLVKGTTSWSRSVLRLLRCGVMAELQSNDAKYLLMSNPRQGDPCSCACQSWPLIDAHAASDPPSQPRHLCATRFKAFIFSDVGFIMFLTHNAGEE